MAVPSLLFFWGSGAQVAGGGGPIRGGELARGCGRVWKGAKDGVQLMWMWIGQEFQTCGQAESGEQEQGQAEEEITPGKSGIRIPKSETGNCRFSSESCRLIVIHCCGPARQSGIGDIRSYRGQESIPSWAENRKGCGGVRSPSTADFRACEEITAPREERRRSLSRSRHCLRRR